MKDWKRKEREKEATQRQMEAQQPNDGNEKRPSFRPRKGAVPNTGRHHKDNKG